MHQLLDNPFYFPILVLQWTLLLYWFEMAIMIYLFDKRKNRKCVQKKGDKETEENTRNVFIYLPLRPANGLSFYMHTRIHACINPRVSRQSIQICHYLSIVIQQVRFCTNICVCVCVCVFWVFLLSFTFTRCSPFLRNKPWTAPHTASDVNLIQ